MASSLCTAVPTAFVAAALLVGCGGAQKRHAELQNQSDSLRIELAELYVQKDARQAAVPLLQRILAERPTDVRARVLYGSVLRDLGLYPQAEAELRRALQLEPRRSDAHAAIAILLDLTGRHDDAVAHHTHATQLAPGMADYRNNLGFSLLAAGKADAAIAPLEAALAIDPGLAHAYANLGFAYGRAGRFADAERTFRAGLGEAGALINLSLVHAERGDVTTAAALRERAYILAPDMRPTSSSTESP
jgi:tetratricopeptide (TPR) repeat protein